MSNREPSYPLGMQQTEIDRLGRQHSLWRAQTEALWSAAGIGAGKTVVDLGSGPGFCSIDLASQVGPTGRVIAVDASPVATCHVAARADLAAARNIEVVTVDASDFDPSSWDVDVVFSRWLFCYLPDPSRVLNSVCARLRTGATVAVMDYWNYRAIRCEPSTPLFAKTFQAVYTGFADAGGSLDVAGELPRLFHAAGLAVTHILPFCQVGRPGSPCWCWLSDFQDVYLPVLVERGYLRTGEVADYQNWWRDQEQNPDAFLFTPPVLGVVGIKSAQGSVVARSPLRTLG